jgi:hypothetical protein
MRRRTASLVALLVPGALALHELRYRLGYHEHADAALVAHGHAYLPAAEALGALLLVVLATGWAVALARGRATGAAPPRRAGQGTWLTMSVALLAVHLGQEWLEEALAASDGAGHLLEHGGWLAPLLALGIGAVLVLLLRGADRAAEVTARRRARRLAGAAPEAVAAAPAPPARPALAVLARGGAGRAPPPRPA